MKLIKIKNNRRGPVLGRHPWIFSGAAVKVPEGLESGEPVRIVDEENNFLALGYFSSYSQIAVRIWSYDEKEETNQEFFTKRIKRAYEIRKKYINNEITDSYRLINSENDFLPGLIVDKYADYLVLQCHTVGITRWKKEILEALISEIKPKGIFEKSDIAVRKYEKIESEKQLLFGDIPERIIIKENNLQFYVDVLEGQKTGFFLDQRDKRLALQKYVNGKNVLNCFSYTGGFSIYALAAGAKRVVSVDSSESALDIAKDNVKLNNLDINKCDFIKMDAMNYFNKISKNKYEVVILDPPAFIKDRRRVREGVKGYRHINENAFRHLPDDGILVTCSCSAHLSMSDFRFVVSEAAGRAKRSMQIFETQNHGLDHLMLAPFLEGEYLKVIFGIVK